MVIETSEMSFLNRRRGFDLADSYYFKRSKLLKLSMVITGAWPQTSKAIRYFSLAIQISAVSVLYMGEVMLMIILKLYSIFCFII